VKSAEGNMRGGHLFIPAVAVAGQGGHIVYRVHGLYFAADVFKVYVDFDILHIVSPFPDIRDLLT
jgi:hypothetical protein